MEGSMVDMSKTASVSKLQARNKSLAFNIPYKMKALKNRSHKDMLSIPAQIILLLSVKKNWYKSNYRSYVLLRKHCSSLLRIHLH